MCLIPESGFIYVPVAFLMNEGGRKHDLLMSEGPVDLLHLEDYLDGVRESFERWYSVAGGMVPAIYSRFHTHLGMIEDIRSQFHRVLEIDDGTAFEQRSVLLSMLGIFDDVMDLLASVFTGPSELREFYFNISSRLRLTLESIIIGDDE
jgi:hypothetical protein